MQPDHQRVTEYNTVDNNVNKFSYRYSIFPLKRLIDVTLHVQFRQMAPVLQMALMVFMELGTVLKRSGYPIKSASFCFFRHSR